MISLNTVVIVQPAYGQTNDMRIPPNISGARRTSELLLDNRLTGMAQSMNRKDRIVKPKLSGQPMKLCFSAEFSSQKKSAASSPV